MPTAKLLVMETTRSAACPKQLEYQENRRKGNTALGSDGQGPKGFSFGFLDLFDFFDLFADLARACLGFFFLERPSRSCEFVRVGMVRTIAHSRLRGPVRP